MLYITEKYTSNVIYKREALSNHAKKQKTKILSNHAKKKNT